MHDDQQAIAEYKKAIALDPDYANAHNNLGLTYLDAGNVGGAITEFREAKRLSPDSPDFRQNLASALMKREPRTAIVELRKLKAKFPNFEVCHTCAWETLCRGITIQREQRRNFGRRFNSIPQILIRMWDWEAFRKSRRITMRPFRNTESRRS
jgi:tetratricopeptide (TPR) repeat protein